MLVTVRCCNLREVKFMLAHSIQSGLTCGKPPIVHVRSRKKYVAQCGCLKHSIIEHSACNRSQSIVIKSILSSWHLNAIIKIFIRCEKRRIVAMATFSMT